MDAVDHGLVPFQYVASLVEGMVRALGFPVRALGLAESGPSNPVRRLERSGSKPSPPGA